jgi:glycosyltransferase involved in cell wall biosynthesis
VRNRKIARVTTIPLSLGLLMRGQLAYMQRDGFDVVGISSPGEWLDRVGEREGVRTVPIPMTRAVSPLADLRSLAALVRVFRRERFDIVHTHTPKAGLLGMVAALLAGVPVRLHTFAGATYRPRTLAQRAWAASDHVTARCATSCLAISHSLRDLLAARGVGGGREIAVIGHGSSNGLDLGRFRRTAGLEREAARGRDALGIPPGALVILFVGRVVRDKGVVELFEAFDLLARSDDRPYLVVAGPRAGESDRLPERVEAALDAHPRVRCLGYRDDVPALMAMADLLAVPTYREGFGNVFIEAAALGVPIVATRVPGVVDAVRDGRNGLLVEPESVKPLRDALDRLIRDETLRRVLGAAGPPFVEERFDQPAYWARLAAHYRRLLDGAA